MGTVNFWIKVAYTLSPLNLPKLGAFEELVFPELGAGGENACKTQNLELKTDPAKAVYPELGM